MGVKGAHVNLLWVGTHPGQGTHTPFHGHMSVFWVGHLAFRSLSLLACLWADGSTD